MDNLKDKVVAKLIKTVTSVKFQTFLGIVFITIYNDPVPGFFQLSPATLDRVIAEAMIYMGVVGVTDHGKEKAKIEAEAEAKEKADA